MTIINQEKLFTSQEVAEILRCNEVTVRKHARKLLIKKHGPDNKRGVYLFTQEHINMLDNSISNYRLVRIAR